MIGASPRWAAVRSTEPELSLFEFKSVGRRLTRARGTSHYTETPGTRILFAVGRTRAGAKD
jgi:hypothetical protein